MLFLGTLFTAQPSESGTRAVDSQDSCAVAGHRSTEARDAARGCTFGQAHTFHHRLIVWHLGLEAFAAPPGAVTRCARICSSISRFTPPWQRDGRSRELRAGSTRVRLQEQPFEILRLMLERPGNVVTRDEFRRRL